MASKKMSMVDIVREYNIADQTILNVFYKVLTLQNISTYNEKLIVLFSFAIKNKVLFTKINVIVDGSSTDILQKYIEKWVSAYINNRVNDKLLVPLKNYGERDEALISRVRASTKADEHTLQLLIDGHYLFMSAENMNGAILEQYLAEVLEPNGWFWCAGSIYRAIDFCYFDENNIVLLQVKNKYNTENSSSSAIRLGTNIIKWNRLKRPRAKYGVDRPLPNWEALQKIVNIPQLNHRLTEESYLEYIEQNSTNQLDSL